MRAIACPSCSKYGTTEIVESKELGPMTKITRRCISCGSSLETYKFDSGGHITSHIPPPKPPTMPDLVGPIRDDHGRLLWDPEV